MPSSSTFAVLLSNSCAVTPGQAQDVTAALVYTRSQLSQNSGTGAPVPAALPPGRPVRQQRCSRSQSCAFAGSPVRSDGGTAGSAQRHGAGPRAEPPGAGGGSPLTARVQARAGCGGCRTPRHNSSLPLRRELLFLLPPTLPKRCSAPGRPTVGARRAPPPPLTGLGPGVPGRRLPPQDVLAAGKCPRRAAAAGCQARPGTSRAGRRAGPVTGAGPPGAARPPPPALPTASCTARCLPLLAAARHLLHCPLPPATRHCPLPPATRRCPPPPALPAASCYSPLPTASCHSLLPARRLLCPARYPAPPYLPAGRDEEGAAPHTRPGRSPARGK
ncbi:transcription initiation factor TFIID subunit 4-like [Ammospiza nelsoni]|uniref:transcription initiation factor TFIID subunit 4-like n=1 Tax=Ammospiza nelsoni TaxID=2857394 RepID=UPI00286AE764|nr:transcription initiation factor TFIID subunit 4-like [Ammospiza nelsoni]